MSLAQLQLIRIFMIELCIDIHLFTLLLSKLHYLAIDKHPLPVSYTIHLAFSDVWTICLFSQTLKLFFCSRYPERNLVKEFIAKGWFGMMNLNFERWDSDIPSEEQLWARSARSTICKTEAFNHWKARRNIEKGCPSPHLFRHDTTTPFSYNTIDFIENTRYGR